MPEGALEVGSVFTRLGFRVDESGAISYETRRKRLQEESKREIVSRASVKTDTTGFDHYNRGAAEAARHTGNLEKATQGAEGRLSRYGIGIRETGVALLGGVGAFGLVEGLRAAIDREGELQKTEARTQSALRSTHGQAGITAKGIEELAKRYGNMAGVDHELVQQSENTLLAFTKVHNEAGRGNNIFDQATKAALNLSVATGRDATSSATMLGKALQDPVKGLGLLSRIGVQFDDQTKAHIKTLVAHGKQLEAQKIVLAQVTERFGGAAAAAGKTMPAALNRMKVAVEDGFGALGKLVAPALTSAANWMTKFVRGLELGRGSAGAFGKGVRTAFTDVKIVVGAVTHFIGQVIDDNRATLTALGKTFGKLWTDVKGYMAGVKSALESVFGSGSGGGSTGRDIRSVISALLSFISMLAKVEEEVVRKVMPGIIAAFRGLATIVKGIIEVIAGLLHGDFSKMWKGVEDIFRGAVNAVAGLLRAAVAQWGVLASKAGGAVLGAIEGLPGAALSIGKRFVSALASGLRGIPNAIASAFSAGGNFLGNIGQGIANWLNAHTPFGDSIKVGPIHVKLPALRRGGKAGPGEGGPAVVYGEGAKDEWWISQEGDRRQNIGWAVEALQSLTGKGVSFFRKGGKKAKKKKVVKPTLPEGTNAGIKRSVRRGEGGIKNFENDIQRMERRYDQLDREYGMSEETFVVENDDGSATVDQSAVDQRAKELDSLHAYRQKIKDQYLIYKQHIRGLITTYTTAIARLTRAIKAAKGRSRGHERAGYLAERQTYQQRVADLSDVAKDIDLDLTDQDLDLQDLDNEKHAVTGSAGHAAPAAPDTSGGSSGGDTSAGSAGDTSAGGDTSGSTGDTTPSAADVAAAALADFASFNASRQSLFSNMGGNYMSREGLAALLLGTAPATVQAAGLRSFGAVPAEGTTVNITNNFGGGPTTPQTWAQQQQFAVEAAMG